MKIRMAVESMPLVVNLDDTEAARDFVSLLPLDQVAEGYRAMDERRAIKTILRP